MINHGNPPHVEIIGHPNVWTLISRSGSKKDGWMNSTLGMEIKGLGVLIEVKTESSVALQFIPGCIISDDDEGYKKIIRQPRIFLKGKRQLESIDPESESELL